MGNKAEERERRKAEKDERFEASKSRLIDRVSLDLCPSARHHPVENSFPRMAPHNALVAAQRATRNPVAELLSSRFSSKVTWCLSKTDLIGSWSWNEPRALAPQEIDEDIKPQFKSFESGTWAEIDNQSSGTGHKMHHGHDISDIIAEAQERWREIDLMQFDTVFRFRLGGKKRAWGYIAQAHFFFVWWDRNHSIYPTEKH